MRSIGYAIVPVVKPSSSRYVVVHSARISNAIRIQVLALEIFFVITFSFCTEQRQVEDPFWVRLVNEMQLVIILAINVNFFFVKKLVARGIVIQARRIVRVVSGFDGIFRNSIPALVGTFAPGK